MKRRLPSRPARDASGLGRDFRLLWTGQSISELGDRVSDLALPLLAATVLHASIQEVALLSALVWTPNLLGMLVGTWVDQHPRKQRLMVLADLVRAVSLCSLPLACLLHVLTLGQLYAVALVNGTAAVFFGTAYASVFTRLIPRGSYLAANSRLNTSRSASYAVGPSLGGVLVQAFGAPIAAFADAASFLASALTVRRIHLTTPPARPGPAQTPFLRRTAEGFSLVLRAPLIRACLGCCTTVNFFTFLSSGILVVYANRTLGLSPGTIGAALGVGSGGALLGAVLAPRLAGRFGVGRSIALGAVLFPAPLSLTAAAGGPLWARVVMLGSAEFLSGIGVMLFDVNLNSLQASAIPDAMRSRVSGVFSAVNYGVRPVGALLGGMLAASFGMRATMFAAAIGGAASVFWVLASPIVSVRSLSDISTPDPIRESTEFFLGRGTAEDRSLLPEGAFGVSPGLSPEAFLRPERRTRAPRS